MPINGNAFPNVLIGTNLADIINGFGGRCADRPRRCRYAQRWNWRGRHDRRRGQRYLLRRQRRRRGRRGFDEGIDRIVTTINLTLNAPGRLDVENLTLTGGASSASVTAWTM